jgi:hypothetical protein
MDRRLGEFQSRSRRGGEEKNSQPSPGIEPENPDHPSRILVAIPAELSRLFILTRTVSNLFSRN